MAGESFVSWTLTPVTTADEVRALTGYKTEADCSTTDLTALIAHAQGSVTDELSERVHDVAMWGVVDGVNARFDLPPRFHGRVLFDAQNTGDEKASFQVYLRHRPIGTISPTYSLATVTSADALHGQIVLSAAPDPAQMDRVMFTGLLVLAAVTKNLFKNCVQLYAAHLLEQRVRGPGKVVLSNPQAEGASRAIVAGRGKWLDIYEREVARIRRPGSRAASIKTRMPGLPDSWWENVGRQTAP